MMLGAGRAAAAAVRMARTKKRPPRAWTIVKYLKSLILYVCVCERVIICALYRQCCLRTWRTSSSPPPSKRLQQTLESQNEPLKSPGAYKPANSYKYVYICYENLTRAIRVACLFGSPYFVYTQWRPVHHKIPPVTTTRRFDLKGPTITTPTTKHSVCVFKRRLGFNNVVVVSRRLLSKRLWTINRRACARGLFVVWRHELA